MLGFLVFQSITLSGWQLPTKTETCYWIKECRLTIVTIMLSRTRTRNNITATFAEKIKLKLSAVGFQNPDISVSHVKCVCVFAREETGVVFSFTTSSYRCHVDTETKPPYQRNTTVLQTIQNNIPVAIF